MKIGILDSLRCLDGGWSTMRITTMLICVVVLTMWVAFCFIEGRFIPLGWEIVALLGGSQGAKAAQLRFEVGKQGLSMPPASLLSPSVSGAAPLTAAAPDLRNLPPDTGEK